MHTWIIRLDQGDYLERRGGWDWGRVGVDLAATQFATRDEAEVFAGLAGSAFREIALVPDGAY